MLADTLGDLEALFWRLKLDVQAQTMLNQWVLAFLKLHSQETLPSYQAKATLNISLRPRAESKMIAKMTPAPAVPWMAGSFPPQLSGASGC